MKLINNILSKFSLGVVLLAATSCDGYLNEIPKGQKTPTTWEDYNAFMRNNNTSYFESEQLLFLTGDYFRSPTALNSSELTRANYLYLEDVDRTLINSSDYQAYYSAYEMMFYWNLIIEEGMNSTEATDDQRRMLVAQAKVLRAMTYHYIVNYHADQYWETTKDQLSVPLATSASVESATPQATLQEIYDFMVSDLKEAIPYLPKHGETILHPTKAAGYGMLARVLLSMGRYSEAREAAESALAENSALYDWVKFYNDEKDRIENTAVWNAGTNVNPEIDNPENYVYHQASSSYWQGQSGGALTVPVERAAKFEEGDIRLIGHWRYYVTGAGVEYYRGIYANVPNYGGIRSAEMYYIKAECQARAGEWEDALETVNTVRRTRFLPEYYKDLTAADQTEAINKIIDDKANEFIQTQVIFCDYRRLNKEGLYPRTLTKTIDDVTYTLKPNSHLWIMPYPIQVLNNPGNNPIVQTVDM
ncbi:MAG: RagB/SusD family nutrient uptake outer membrane protein [Duncaniella sp.]|uniref:RagB/SusD family nutrient uptake outer membrane protein n=1 Tax=Duncaniella sp. TaxID=2518496 RepID=UPI0023CD41A1|nr:RagB/SusD family nutrient uptake outer membrane protein [Duncaniella sp.]MDE6090574.1 RagB/SusD family nutrient uptake outer membrane protein [Duncaniella sp.]